MSSNELHITRANYEAYFLLYVDGELTPAQCDAVEAFAALHPDLQEELDLLLTTRLDAETISFDKTTLLADSMKQSVIDESLLLYIDDELKGKEKKDLEEKMANDATYQYQHNLLRQAKLPAEAISYPNKAELYRREKRTMRPVIWYRAAAAVFVLMASGYMWYMSQNTVSPTPSVATAPAGKNTPAQPSTPTSPVAAPTTNDIAATDQVNAPGTNEQQAEAPLDRVSDKVMAASYSEPAIAKQTTNSQPTEEVRLDVAVTRNTSIAEPAVSQPIAAISEPQQDINNLPVTKTLPTAYNSYTKEIPADDPGHNQAVALETEKEKRGTVKSFLRKATRIIERRTGIASTTNENDELLIGAVAIKLK